MNKWNKIEGKEHTAYTCLAPALAQNKDKIPVPAPTSRTTLSLNKNAFMHIAF